jgi:hypothetical protein
LRRGSGVETKLVTWIMDPRDFSYLVFVEIYVRGDAQIISRYWLGAEVFYDAPEGVVVSEIKVCEVALRIGHIL